MSLVKEKVIEAIKKLPDTCSIDDIMYEVYFITQVLEGIKDADDGNLTDHEEVRAEIKSW
ncbi:MAG: hypothetical protein AB1546_06490 [bacterium]